MRKPPLRSHQQPAASYVPVHRYPGAGGDSLAMAVAVTDGEESFAELFEASLKSPKKAIARRDPDVGELVQGEVVQVGAEFAFLDIGAKAEALISLAELRDENGEVTIHVGDKLEGHVISSGGKEGGIVVSGKLQRGAGLRDQLQMAYEQAVPVEGLVTGVNKGGLDIDLGGVRAFLPASQIELRYCQEPGSYVGRALTLRVTRFDEDARNVVVSRRAILEIEQRAMAEKTREKVIPGVVFNGVVTSVRDYGAFVDIGGLEGLVHVSELGYGRSLRADETVKPGQRVEVVVLRIEEGEGGKDPKISLSLKALMADPMDEMLQSLKEGDRITGKVMRLEPFGAFVQLQPGVEGLIHISAMAERHVTHPREVMSLGNDVTVTVISLDRERRRIGLSLIEEMRAAQVQAASTLAVGEVVMAVVDRVEPHGVVVRVKAKGEGGIQPKGTIFNAELNVPRGSDNKRLFPAGKEVRALVQSIEGDSVRLSIRGAEMKEERDSISAYSGGTSESAGKATLGEMLRSKLPAVVPEAAPEPGKAVAKAKVTKPKVPKEAAASADGAEPAAEAKPKARKAPASTKKTAAAAAESSEAAPAAEPAPAPAKAKKKTAKSA